MIISIIKEDIIANRRSGWLSWLIFIIYRIGSRAYELRQCGSLWGRFVGAAVSIPYKVVHLLAGSSLPFSARIGRRLSVPHGFYGVFISSRAVIGDDVTILHQVTVGSNYGGKKSDRAPIIEDGVFLGAGAKAIGDILIGAGAKIGAGAVVVNSVPPKSVAFAQKAYIASAQRDLQ